MNWQEAAGNIVSALRHSDIKKDIIELQEKHLGLLTKEIETLTLKLTESKSEIANLKAKLYDLEQELGRLKPKDDLPPDAIKMLDRLFNEDLAIEYLAKILHIERGMAEHYRDILFDALLIEQTGVGFTGFGAMGDWVDTSGSYGLTAKGREYVAKRRSQR
jgi:predicted nuclease with TOPRIM domain